MAETVKRLGATTVVANTDTTLYTVPAGTSAVVSSVVACNRGAGAHTFRIAHVDGAIGVVANEDYIFYDKAVAANDSEPFTLGIAMEAGDTLLVRADHAEVNFIAWGAEIT